MENKVNSVKFKELCADLLRQGHAVRFAAAGRSMRPTIRDGEVITVEPVAPGAVRWGDIVLCQQDRGLVAHRVIRENGGGGVSEAFTLRGDGSPRSRHEVAHEHVLGRVVAVERQGRMVPLHGTGAKVRAALRIRLEALGRRLARVPSKRPLGRERGGA